MGKKVFVGIFGLSIFLCLIHSSVSLAENKKDNLYKQVELFSDALTIIRADYVDQASSKDLIYGALKGMLASLDPYSQFLDPQDYNELKVDTEGKFGGIGIEITLKDGLITVITPIEDTPAWKAGIKTDDRIVKINNEVTRDMTLGDAVKRLRGKPGEAVTVVVLREAEKKLLEFKIVRDVIKIKDIKEARILTDGIAYIRLTEFRENTPGDFSSVLGNLKKQNMDSLILDLRNNPGGLLDVAAKIAEKFIENGKIIVYTKGRKGMQDLEFISRNKQPLVGIPMVVLINEGSASGSEIVAGALQDYKRAIILGKKSFGKGSVQTVIPLSDGSALRLTTSRYFTPLGQQIHGKGIKPDIVAQGGEVKVLKKSEPDIIDKSEAVFDEIENKENKEEDKGKAEDKKGTKKEAFNYASDNQIMRAIDALKALKFSQESKQGK